MKHLAFLGQFLLEYDKLKQKVQKQQSLYQGSCYAVEMAKGKYERSDEKSKEKTKRIWHQEILDMNNCKVVGLITFRTSIFCI
jgi:formin-binding protein 1